VTSAMGRYLKTNNQFLWRDLPCSIGSACNVDSSSDGSDDKEDPGASWERVFSIHQHQGSVLSGKSEQVSPQEKQEGVEGHLLHHHCSCLAPKHAQDGKENSKPRKVSEGADESRKPL